jgi:hypothetical protein
MVRVEYKVLVTATFSVWVATSVVVTATFSVIVAYIVVEETLVVVATLWSVAVEIEVNVLYWTSVWGTTPSRD